MAYHPFRHLGLKVLAIALATLLWLTVAGEHVVERSLRVPLEFRNIPATLGDRRRPAGRVDVRLRGSSALLGRLGSGRGRRGARPDVRAHRARGCSTCATTRSARRSASRSRRCAGDGVAGAREVGERRRAGRPGDRGRSGAGLRRRARSSPSRRRSRSIGPESHVRHVAEATTEPVDIDGKRRARQRRGDDRRRRFAGASGSTAAERDRDGRDSAGAGRAGDGGRAGPLAQPGAGLRAQGRAGGRPRQRARPARGARALRADASTRSWTLPGSEPAGTICAFRSIQHFGQDQSARQ